MKSRSLPGDTDDADVGLEADERVSDYDWFMRAIKYFATEGEPQYKRAINYLRAGIWEFKHGKKRLTFYDTSGGGRFRPKAEIVDHRDAEEPNSEHWNVPYFDPELRLGHWFLKDGPTTRVEELETAEKVRDEDLAHDKESDSEIEDARGGVGT